jgi:hypothetical protein
MSGSQKPRSREHRNVKWAEREQKQKHGGVGTETVLRAAKRSSRRAKDPQSMETAQVTLQQVDVTTQKRLADWVNRENPVDVLRDSIDPQYGRAYALQTAALRADADLDQYTARAEESSAGAAANVVSRRTRAAQRAAQGYKRISTRQDIDAAGKVKVRKRTVVMTGEQVQEKARRDRKLKALPPTKRPTSRTQTLAPGTILPSWKAYGGRRTAGTYKRAEGVRSQAEISRSAQARKVRQLAGGVYRVVILKSAWSDQELRDLGFRPYHKLKRHWDFKGPTAEADAEAFERTMMEWLENPDRVGPPPQPRKH